MDDLSDMAALFGPLLPERDVRSPVERLLNEFEAHEAKEEKSVEQYKNFLAELPDPITRLLLQLIIADEEKHRAIIRAMIATLKASLTWSTPAGTLTGAADLTQVSGALRSVTDAFIDLENEGIREYKTLAKASSGYYHGLFKVLVESMIRDSEKHVQLLEFLSRHLKRT